MIMECGMSSEIGPVYISDEKSAETRRVIDSEITKMLREAHKRVTDMLVKPSNTAVSKIWGGGRGVHSSYSTIGVMTGCIMSLYSVLADSAKKGCALFSQRLRSFLVVRQKR